MPNRYDLVCFDMDGTLTNIRSTWKWVHQCLGTSNEKGYQDFVNQKITEEEFMRSDISTWKSARPGLSVRDLIKIFQQTPLVDGIQETVASLQACGMRCVIISGGIDIAAEMLANEFGFDGYIADRLQTDDEGRLTGEGIKVVDLADKGVWVRKFIDKYGTTGERTVSIGNSFTDIPMFKNSGLSIAFNPLDEYTSGAATYTVRSGNISDVLDYIIEEPDDKVTHRRGP